MNRFLPVSIVAVGATFATSDDPDSRRRPGSSSESVGDHRRNGSHRNVLTHMYTAQSRKTVYEDSTVQADA